METELNNNNNSGIKSIIMPTDDKKIEIKITWTITTCPLF